MAQTLSSVAVDSKAWNGTEVSYQDSMEMAFGNNDGMSEFVDEHHRLIVIILLAITICLFIICIGLLIMLKNLNTAPSSTSTANTTAQILSNDESEDEEQSVDYSITIQSAV